MEAEIFIQNARLNLQADIASINRGGKININPELKFKYPTIDYYPSNIWI
jgi:hypothetical protein